MSEKFESLVGDLKTAFGGDFGEAQPQIVNLQEAVEISLTEKMRPMPARGGFARGGAMRQAPPERRPEKKGGPRLRDKREMAKRVAGADKGFRQDVEAGAAKAAGDKHAAVLRDIEREIDDVAGGGAPEDAMMNISKVLKSLGARSTADAMPQKAPRKEPEKKMEPRRHPVRRAPQGSPAGGGGGGAPAKHAGGGGGGKEHNPFKRNSNLGLGPGTPPGHPKVVGQRHHDETKCWSCNCPGGAYGGCKCTALGTGSGCPERDRDGKPKVKMVYIDRKYHNDYNKMYHEWRKRHQPRSNRVTGAQHHMYRTPGA